MTQVYSPGSKSGNHCIKAVCGFDHLVSKANLTQDEQLIATLLKLFNEAVTSLAILTPLDTLNTNK